MPTYFFHLRDGIDLLLDPEGQVLGSMDAVARIALAEARALIAHDAFTGRIDLDRRIEVEDDAGRIVHRLLFRNAVEILPAAKPETGEP